MKINIFLKSFLMLSAIALSSGENTYAQLQYPVTKKVEQTDDYFGTKVSDPYRWLEDDTSAETKAWVKTQQKFTNDYLAKIPFRADIKKRYQEILKCPKYSGAFKVGEYIFYSRNDGMQNQSVYYFQKGINGQAKVFLDPNTMSADGSVSVGLDGASNDKKYMVYHINKGGSDWQTLYIMEIATQKKLDDEIDWVKFGGAAWAGNGFYYTRYDKPAEGTELTAKTENPKIYYHVLGNKQQQDKFIYEDKENPQMFIGPSTTEDERFLILFKSRGTDGTELWYKNLKNGQSDFKLLLKGFDYNYSVTDNIGDKLLVYTNNGAGNYRVVLVDPSHPEKENWKDVIAEKPEKLESANTAGGKLFASYLKDASTRIYQYALDGHLEHAITLPGIGSASNIGAYKNDAFSFYDFTSFTYPPSIFQYDIATGISTLFKKSEAKVDIDAYQTEQVFYPSKDGTKVPMFIIHKKGIKLDGSHPTLLYAYGGFNISLTPYFSNTAFILLENDGAYAVANLRGGGEYGETWHKAGNLLNKQNVFDDFIAAGEYLINKKYTTRERLAINGGSNGGLLIGAVMAQRPDLCKVALPEVGVMDMLRYQKFTVGWGWAVEYGSSDSAKYFSYLYKYSPLHNIKSGVAYPATMVFTADHDDRVVPAHSFKFAATLQEKQTGAEPVLIRIDTDQGHGASGSSLSKMIDEQTDKWAFMFYNMGITPKF